MSIFDMLDEITEPTGPVLSWKAQVHIKQFLTNEEHLTPEQYHAIGSQIASKLKHCTLLMEDSESEYIVYSLEHADSHAIGQELVRRGIA